MKHKKTSFAILFGLLSLSLAISGSASWIITSPTINGRPSNIREDNSVCYIEETGYYYDSLEGAINDANAYVAGPASNAKVIVIPGKTVYINNNTTLSSGVDLLMPYTTSYSTTLDSNHDRVALDTPEMTEIRKDDDGLYIAKYLYTYGGNNYPKETEYSSLAEYDNASSTFADANGNTTKISSTLVIKNNVELTISNNSQMVVYGQLGRPGQNLNGHTSGYFSQVILMRNAKINVNQGGILDVRGYIKESNNDEDTLNYTQITNNGTIYVPFVVYDFCGGSATVAIYANANECPFSQYDMPNIHSTISTQNSGSVKARADLYTGYQDLNPTIDNHSLGTLIRIAFEAKGIHEEDLKFYPQQNVCFVDIIGNASSNILKTEKESKIITKYHPTNQSPITIDGVSYLVGNTNDVSKSGLSSNKLGTTTLNIYGDVDIGYLTLNVSIFEQIVPISTSGIYFPIPWQMDVNFFNGNINVSNKIKLLPGAQAKFTNCKINLSNAVMSYNKNSWRETTSTYPTNQDSIIELNYSELSIASSASFGGYITLNQSSINNHSNYNPSTIIANSSFNNNPSTTESEGGSMSLGGLMEGDITQSFNNLADFMLGNKGFDDDVKSVVASAFTTTTRKTISLIAQTDLNSKGNKTTIEPAYKYISEDGLDYFNDIRLINDKVDSVTLSTSSGDTESIMSDFNDQVVATINPSLATQYTIYWDDLDDSNAPGATLTKTDNPLIRDIYIPECSIDNGSYSVNVTINITNTLDGSVVSNSITLYSHGPLTTARLVNENGDVNPKLVKNDGGRSDQDPDIHKLNLEITSDLLGPDDEILEIFDITWTINEGNDKITSGASWENTVYFNGNDTLQKLKNVTSAEVYLRPSNDADGTIKVDLYKKGTSTVVTSVTIEYDVYGGCFEAGTIVNTKDGNKPVEDLRSDDLILSYNHYKGQYEYQPIFAVVNHGKSLYDVIELYFDDGSYIGLIATHGLYDLTLNKYVEITQNNYKEFINHRFAKYNENGAADEVVLVSFRVVEKLTSSYTVITANNYNCVANSLLNVTSMLHGFYNIFDYIDNMMYNPLQVQTAIATYGLFTYEEWSDYVSYEIFAAINGPYFKLAVGNGSITYGEIYYVIEWYYSLIESGEIVISPYLQMSSN